MARLETYTSSADLLKAVTPHLLPDREWQSHLLLGLNLENAHKPPDSLNLYATTWVEEELQMALFHFHTAPVNITHCREVYDMRHFDQQIQLLASYVLAQPQEVTDSYSIISALDVISKPLVAHISKGLGREVERVLNLKGSYIDKSKFIFYPLPDPAHI